MEFRRLTEGGSDLYQRAMELYEISFPVFEQREPESQIEIMGHEEYRFHLIYDEETWVGMILCWETEDFIYIEHFCTRPQLRNRGYGQRTLELLKEAKKTVILEIEPPVDEISVSRKAFYEAAGYKVNPYTHIPPRYRKEFEEHSFVVMSWPRELPEETYRKFDRYLRDVVMSR